MLCKVRARCEEAPRQVGLKKRLPAGSMLIAGVDTVPWMSRAWTLTYMATPSFLHSFVPLAPSYIQSVGQSLHDLGCLLVRIRPYLGCPGAISRVSVFMQGHVMTN